jgi:3-hydroxyisobutyrate dehydrogenase-like beta-hydroxyacid dehydrogenase
MKTVGFIGTGGMGSGMAANLIKAGYRLVAQSRGRIVRARAFDAAEQRCSQGRRPRQGWAH